MCIRDSLRVLVNPGTGRSAQDDQLQLFAALLMMNMMIGVVVDNFSNTSTKENMLVSETEMMEFVEEWHRLDKDSSYYISSHYLPTLLNRLLPPLGFWPDLAAFADRLRQGLCHCA